MHVSAMPLIGLLVGGFPLQLLNALVFWIKCSDDLLLLILYNFLIILFTISNPNHHAPAGMPHHASLHPVEGICLRHVPLWFFKITFTVMVDVPMGPAVWRSPPFWIFLWFAPGLMVCSTASLILRVLVYPCIWMIFFDIAAMYKYLFGRWLGY